MMRKNNIYIWNMSKCISDQMLQEHVYDNNNNNNHNNLERNRSSAGMRTCQMTSLSFSSCTVDEPPLYLRLILTLVYNSVPAGPGFINRPMTGTGDGCDLVGTLDEFHSSQQNSDRHHDVSSCDLADVLNGSTSRLKSGVHPYSKSNTVAQPPV
ncbi:uncharacterized [Tachysurus ichikawai]